MDTADLVHGRRTFPAILATFRKFFIENKAFGENGMRLRPFHPKLVELVSTCS